MIDTSAVLEVIVTRDPDQRLVAHLDDDGDLHAPHLLDVEILHALRGHLRAGRLSIDRAADVRANFAELTISRYGHELLMERMWQLRDNLSAYDATFVALAELLEAPLVTCDARVAAAPGTAAEVQLYRTEG
ncbi:MAG: type II toxin-antitoxin system VapC family toxin [Solirubrobacterales bacterium]